MKFIALLAMLALNSITQSNADNEDWWQYYDRTKTINLKLSDKIKNNYEVNIVWTPDGGLAPVLTGPALINFKSEKWGDSFAVKADYFHIHEKVLKTAGLNIFKDGIFNPKVDLGKTYKIAANPKYLKDVSLWQNEHNIKPTLESTRSHAPFFFEDMDLDGAEELVIASFGSGQRGSTEYLIYEISNRYSRPVATIKNSAPFNSIDQLSSFDISKKTIKQVSSGGACSSSEDTYKKINNIFQHIQHTSWDYRVDIEHGYICTESTYDIVDQKKTLKRVSESYWDSNKLERVELSVKYF